MVIRRSQPAVWAIDPRLVTVTGAGLGEPVNAVNVIEQFLQPRLSCWSVPGRLLQTGPGSCDCSTSAAGSQHPKTTRQGPDRPWACDLSQLHRSRRNPVGCLSWHQAWHQPSACLAQQPTWMLGKKTERLRRCPVCHPASPSRRHGFCVNLTAGEGYRASIPGVTQGNWAEQDSGTVGWSRQSRLFLKCKDRNPVTFGGFHSLAGSCN